MRMPSVSQRLLVTSCAIFYAEEKANGSRAAGSGGGLWMAEIARPRVPSTRETAEASTPRVSFTELAEAWARREGRGCKGGVRAPALRLSSATTGDPRRVRLRGLGLAVAMTVRPPRRVDRWLLRGERLAIYTESEPLIKNHPEIAPVLHRAELRYVSVHNALPGTEPAAPRQLALRLDARSDDPRCSGERRGNHAARARAGAVPDRARRAPPNTTGPRPAGRIVYLGGMLAGVAALCA